MFVDTSQDASFDRDGNYVDGCIIKNCIIEYGKDIWCEYSSPFISSNLIRKTLDYSGIHYRFSSSPIKIVGNIIEDNSSAIYMFRKILV